MLNGDRMYSTIFREIGYILTLGPAMLRYLGNTKPSCSARRQRRVGTRLLSLCSSKGWKAIERGGTSNELKGAPARERKMRGPASASQFIGMPTRGFGSQ